MTRRNSSSGCGPFLLTVRIAVPPPAVFTAMCSDPSAASALSKAASTDAASTTSHGWNVAPIPAATSAPADFGRSRIATSAPASRRASAVARAMPDAPPTTIARFPVISIARFLLGSQRGGPYRSRRGPVDRAPWLYDPRTRHHTAGAFRGRLPDLRRRQPLLRGPRRLHPAPRSEDGS